VPRELRIQCPGGVCHVVHRGDEQGNIFREDADRKRLFSTLGEACGNTI
jgi:hypothetical protein